MSVMVPAEIQKMNAVSPCLFYPFLLFQLLFSSDNGPTY